MMECCGGDQELKRNKKTNKLIEKQIQKDKQKIISTHRLLLLGLSHSGKNTIVKQMRILYNNGFTEYEKRQLIKEIHKFIRNAMMGAIHVMTALKHPFQLQNKDNEWRMDYIQDMDNNPDTDYLDLSQFYEHMEVLSKDRGVLQAFERYNQYYFKDFDINYFLDRLHIIKMRDYMPSEEDILRCSTISFEQIEFEVGNECYDLWTNVRSKKPKSVQFTYLNDLTAFIFMTDSTSYDMVIGEDPKNNRLRESLHLFKSIWNNRWFQRLSFILFLNKEDILTEKVRSGKTKIEIYFPEFIDYKTPPDTLFDAGEDPDLVGVKYFIRDMFLQICHRDNNNNNNNRICSPHFTCAVHTDNIRQVFNHCQDIIKQAHLQQYQLL